MLEIERSNESHARLHKFIHIDELFFIHFYNPLFYSFVAFQAGEFIDQRIQNAFVWFILFFSTDLFRAQK